jgi:hypothetical protein
MVCASLQATTSVIGKSVCAVQVRSSSFLPCIFQPPSLSLSLQISSRGLDPVKLN